MKRMTNLHAQAFEDTLLVLTKRTHHCLFTLLALLRKLPHFSEKHTSSEQAKRDRQRIANALQAAVAQLAERIPGERSLDTLIPQVRQEKEHITSGRTSCDLS